MPLRHTLLGLLDWQPMHGYRLRQHAKEYSWIYPMTNASIYPALHGLEEEGFITHHSEIHNGRARKVYEITAAGRDELRRWLEDPTPQGASFRDQLVLKVAMQSDETIRVSKAWLREAIDALDGEIAKQDEGLEGSAESAKYARLAAEYGAGMLRLRRQFLEQVLAEADQTEPVRSATG